MSKLFTSENHVLILIRLADYKVLFFQIQMKIKCFLSKTIKKQFAQT